MSSCLEAAPPEIAANQSRYSYRFATYADVPDIIRVHQQAYEETYDKEWGRTPEQFARYLYGPSFVDGKTAYWQSVIYGSSQYWPNGIYKEGTSEAGDPSSLPLHFLEVVEDVNGSVVAFCNGVVGYQLELSHPSPAACLVKLVSALYVHPDHQGSGVGSTLLERLLKRFDDKELMSCLGATGLMTLVMVTEDSRAIRLYEKHGFEMTSWPIDYDYSRGLYVQGIAVRQRAMVRTLPTVHAPIISRSRPGVRYNSGFNPAHGYALYRLTQSS